MNVSGRVAGKVALVTGAASGLGLASAIKLLDQGAQVYFSDINEDALNKLPKILSHYEKNQYEIGFHDVASEESWTNILNKVDAKFNRLNILLNSAGIALGGDVVSTGFDVWKKVHDVNLDSIFLGCKLAIPMMSAHGAGSIISISSISGIVAGWNTAAYNSSKAGVRHLSKSVALYCAKKGYNIRSNTIHPAFVDTPILDPHKQAFGEEEALRNTGEDEVSFLEFGKGYKGAKYQKVVRNRLREPYITLSSDKKRLILGLPNSDASKQDRNNLKKLAKILPGLTQKKDPRLAPTVNGLNPFYYFDAPSYEAIRDTLGSVSISKGALDFLEAYYKELTARDRALNEENLKNFTSQNLGGFVSEVEKGGEK
mgnify:CR=1 FL=1